MKWISVKDRLPELVNDGESEDVICLSYKFGDLKREPQVMVMWRDNDKWASWDFQDYDMENCNYHVITHWMPIPHFPAIKD